jgi:hypothetical protein
MTPGGVGVPPARTSRSLTSIPTKERRNTWFDTCASHQGTLRAADASLPIEAVGLPGPVAFLDGRPPWGRRTGTLDGSQAFPRDREDTMTFPVPTLSRFSGGPTLVAVAVLLSGCTDMHPTAPEIAAAPTDAVAETSAGRPGTSSVPGRPDPAPGSSPPGHHPPRPANHPPGQPARRGGAEWGLKRLPTRHPRRMQRDPRIECEFCHDPPVHHVDDPLVKPLVPAPERVARAGKGCRVRGGGGKARWWSAP